MATLVLEAADAANAAALASCSDRSLRTYLNRMINRNSILKDVISNVISGILPRYLGRYPYRPNWDLPLFSHHEYSLY